jgi:phage tail-like protein
MNSNNQRFWMITGETDWITPADAASVDYDNRTRRLRLRSRLDANKPDFVDFSTLNNALSSPSMVVDRFGTVAFWDSVSKSVSADGAFGKNLSPVAICGPLGGAVVCDLALGFDDVLYVSISETTGSMRKFIRFIDCRGRWSVEADVPPGESRSDLLLETMQADRMAADPSGGVWIMDRTNKKISQVKGYPLADHLPGTFSDNVFRPVEENTNIPRLIADKTEITVDKTPIDDLTLVDIACSPDGCLALLIWKVSSKETYLQLRTKDGDWKKADLLENSGQPVSLEWLSENQITVIPGPGTQKVKEALVYDLEFLPEEKRFKPVQAGGYYPLLNITQHVFVNGVTLPPQYPANGGRAARLLPMSVASYHESGEAKARVLDAGADSAVWHRLYMEAKLPQGCGLVVSLAATDVPQETQDNLEWHDHYFGDADMSKVATGSPAHGVWLEESSEIPHHPGLLGCNPLKDRSGLFTVLIQRPGRKVRSLAGRYLHMQIELLGRGHLTPEIAAIRVYGPRFSYRDQYLPELYREELFGADANASGNATPADFLGRFLDLFESVMTPLEDRVAAAQILMDPRSTPPDALEWLGSWLGVIFEPGFPVERRRAWIEAAHRLYQTRGTLAALQLALEIATGGRLKREFVNGRELEFPQGGAVTGGRVIVIEDFRLRRTFATILGADLSVKDDPLLPGGLLSSANSFVGDTLILGDESKKEFLALFSHAFSKEPGTKAEEEQAVFDLYDKLANRVTILVHNEITAEDMGLLRRIVAQETPCHIESRVVNATWPLLVGLSSLVEIDTFLTPHPPRGIARVDESRLGENAFIQRLPSLDPRLTY